MAKVKLIRDLCSAKRNVIITAGECDPMVYNDLRVAAAFEGASRRGVNISVMAGPSIIVNSLQALDPVTSTVAFLIRRMNSAKKRVSIVLTGVSTISRKALKDPCFLAALEGIRQRKVKIELRTGPPIAILDSANQGIVRKLYGEGMKSIKLEKAFQKMR